MILMSTAWKEMFDTSAQDLRGGGRTYFGDLPRFNREPCPLTEQDHPRGIFVVVDEVEN